MREFSQQYPEIDQQWYSNSNYIALLSVENETALRWFIDRADMEGIKHAIFREPDIDNEITAIAMEPGKASKKICSSLPLALSRAG